MSFIKFPIGTKLYYGGNIWYQVISENEARDLNEGRVNFWKRELKINFNYLKRLSNMDLFYTSDACNATEIIYPNKLGILLYD